MTTTDIAARSPAREHRASRSGPEGGLRGSIGNGLLREVALVAGAMLVYFGVRNLTAGTPEEAFANGDRIADFERSLGIAWEDAVQASVVGSDILVTLANWVYIWGHWPVILTTAVVLYLWRRDRYYVLRNALFISGGIGFLFFALVPVAPPRLLELGLVDTVTSRSDAYRALQPPGLTNQYAALPSLHIGWNLAVGIVLFMTTTHLVVRAFAAVSPLAMGFAVVATANHFVVDVVAGVAVVVVGLAGALVIENRRARSTATLALGEWAARVEPAREIAAAAVSRRASRGEPAHRPPGRGTPESQPCRG
jgi:PAP2 superfamily